MITYQDFLMAEDVGELLLNAISEHRDSELYQTALDAKLYDQQRNPTINRYQKLLYTLSGTAVPDNYSANHKIASGFFPFFVTQQNQYLLGNGLLLDPAQKEKLGRDFDIQLQKLGREALVCGVSFGFWNFDRLEVFGLTEFVPLWDEESGTLAAGIRFWQIDEDKPMHITLYTPQGIVRFRKENEGEIKQVDALQPYLQTVRVSETDGEEILGGESYPVLPIVPLWGNPHHQSEIVGIRSQIDAYDLIKSGFANDLDDASMIYWTLTNTCGMDDIDLAKFIEHMKTVRAAVVDGDSGVRAEAHTMEVPYAGRIAYLERLEKDLYHDFQALDTANLMGGNRTATEIRAAYQAMDNKADQYEYCVLDFLEKLLVITGVDEVAPRFQRSRIFDRKEEAEILKLAADALGSESVKERFESLLNI